MTLWTKWKLWYEYKRFCKAYPIAKSKKNWNYIILHHSWSPDNKVTSDWEGIRQYHIKECGWKDIGYHFGIELVNSAVQLKIGRSLETIGAHTKGFNETGIGVCLIGNYDLNILSNDQLKMFYFLCKRLMELYPDINAKHILGHRETYPLLNKPVEKTCPGKLVSMNDIRNLISPET